MKFNCDKCCQDVDEKPQNINGIGQYCNKCMNRMFEEDMFCS